MEDKQEEVGKELYSDGKYLISILDSKNFIVEINGGNRTYYHLLSGAVRKVSRLVANDKAKDLNNWLVAYEATIERLKEQLD